MTPFLFAKITGDIVVYFGLFILLVFLAMIAAFFFSWRKGREQASSTCPYTGNPLRTGADISFATKEKILRYFFDMHDINNRMFDLNKAAICRETERIYPDALTWLGTIQVDWSFIQKRYPGKFVSWGSLSEEQRLILTDRHVSLEGFQTEYSSINPSPRAIEKEFVYRKPGPLYVDIDTGILLGWKIIPDTEIEVLVVQRPIERYLAGVTKKYR